MQKFYWNAILQNCNSLHNAPDIFSGALAFVRINMEKINFNQSLKNIPIPSKSSYQLKLFDKIESVIKHIRWKAHFFMSSNVIECDKESFGFKSKNCPAQIKELEAFKKDLLDIIKSIKIRNINNKFQNLMKADITKVKTLPNVFIPTDKTTNMYELSPTKYEKLLTNNITKTYNKLTPCLENAINLKAKQFENGIT